MCARQNLKSWFAQVVTLFLMMTNRVRTVLGAAQSLQLANHLWNTTISFAQSVPALNREIHTVRRANGTECFTLRNGSQYKVAAATRSAGRGLTVGLLVVDELREMLTYDPWGALSATTTAVPDSLRCVSRTRGTRGASSSTG